MPDLSAGGRAVQCIGRVFKSGTMGYAERQTGRGRMMKATMLAALAAVTVISGCGTVRESRLNPFNWFGGGQSQTMLVEDGDIAAPVDRRGLVDQVVEISVDRAPGGAIVSAVGLPPSQGFWAADLVPANAEIDGDAIPTGGVIVLDFRVFPPAEPKPAGTPPSRELTAGLFLTDQTLAGTRQIVVRGARNQITSSR
ncbi:hypothetical protein [Tropicimonas sp. IMCC34011]|uniref:hypothetical protein n=1 Tax=Tropicimonas sp. IMCC34011 TaxID=2248759 RepID=UPI001E49F69B|nr:hypothetical protein [Tropicimonas sp. IMCC34011]